MQSQQRVRAFTLIEMLIVVGAIAIIGLGVARIFSATGDTVRIGRQLSTLNAGASTLERQIRGDIAQMTRDGVLVTKQEMQSGRRVDQLLFFAKGTFTSNRDPLHPQREVRAPAARIYYGHGHVAEGVSNGATDRIKLSDALDLGYFDGVNADPANWVLLRHVTAMALPRTSQQPVLADPQPANGWYRGNDLLDTDTQVALLPAAASPFRVLNRQAPRRNGARALGGQTQAPAFSSGVVDLVTTDLDEIRAVVLDAQQPASATYPFDPSADDGGGGGTLNTIEGVSYQYGAPASTVQTMQAWMLELFPVRSYGSNPGRMRCAFAAPDAFGVISNGLVDDPGELAEIVADQRMLSASNFVTRCTEFKVEWTFGRPVPGSGTVEPVWQDLNNPYNEATVPITLVYPRNSGPAFTGTHRYATETITRQDVGGTGQFSYFGVRGSDLRRWCVDAGDLGHLAVAVAPAVHGFVRGQRHR